MDVELNLTTESVAKAFPAGLAFVEPQTPLRAVFQQMQGRKAGSMLVCQDGNLAGIFTERDALRLMAKDAAARREGQMGVDWDSAISSVMTAPAATIRESDTVATAIRQMAEGGYRRLPMLGKDGRPTGTVLASRIVHYLVEHFPKTVYNQPPVSHPKTQQREGS